MLNPMKKVSQLARACGVTNDSVYGWIRLGHVRAVRTPSGRLMIPDHEFDRVRKAIHESAAPVA